MRAAAIAKLSETSPYLLQHAYNPVQWYAWNNEALQKAKEFLPNLILMDINMPKKNGIEAAQEIKKIDDLKSDSIKTQDLLNDPSPSALIELQRRLAGSISILILVLMKLLKCIFVSQLIP